LTLLSTKGIKGRAGWAGSFASPAPAGWRAGWRAGKLCGIWVRDFCGNDDDGNDDDGDDDDDDDGNDDGDDDGKQWHNGTMTMVHNGDDGAMSTKQNYQTFLQR
jgi:hypothetical protein